jgi:ribosome-binding protein aMBF1 (putative translation factor)
MITCPNCGYEINGEYFSCEFSCDSTEIYWCEECGAIAIGWNEYTPDDNEWQVPSR